MAPAAYFAKAAKAKERGPTEKKWEVKGGRREEIVNVKVNVNEKAKGGNRKKTLRSLRLSGKKPRIIDLFFTAEARSARRMAPAERGPTEKKWEVKGGRREEIVNVKVNVNEKAKGGNRKKTLRSLRLSGKKPRIIDLFFTAEARSARRMAPAERGPTEKKWEVKGGRREEIVNVKVNVNEKAKGGNRKKTLRSLRLSGKKPRIIDLGSGSDPD